MFNTNHLIKGLLFDFDGLILDTEGPIYQSWHEMFESFGGDLPLSLWGTIIGTNEMTFDPWEMLEEQHGKEIDREAAASKRLQREEELIQQQPVMPGITSYLNEGRRMGLKIGVVSSSSRRWVAGHLERLGLLEYFNCLATSDDVKITKPNPELYLLALNSLGLDTSQAVAFEDSTNGITAAKAAGIYVVAVPNDLTRHLPLDHADKRLNSLADIDLMDLLLEINKTRR
ncbi:MAG: HAD family phosphatase [Chloroflexi bacterium]|nr:MAG: HAD family phosphatase [Chloroflexota bacterium]